MITLAFDSVAKIASVALCDGERVLAQYSIDNGMTQSELLLPMAESILSSVGLSFSDVGLYACTTGPGSFTGVRIGVSLIKGLAFGKGTPCVSVSSLESLAENAAGLRGVIVPVMDARRSQVYCAIFESDGENLERVSEDMALPLTELAELLKKYEGKPIYLTGDGYGVAMTALTSLGITLCNTPEGIRGESAASCARVALRMYKNGKAIADTELAPTYLRLPQAERERLEREKQNK